MEGGLKLFAPRRAAVMQHLRLMESDADYRESVLALMRLQGYRAARKGTNNTAWLDSGRSADAEVLGDLPVLRSRARELGRDDAIASGISGSFCNNVIGTGITPQARTEDEETNRRLEAVWAERALLLDPVDMLPHGQAQRLVFRKWFEDGEVLRKVAKVRPHEPVWFETIEADRLATPREHLTNPRFRNGVERDEHGRVVAYWIMRSHPGDLMGGPVMRDANQFVRTSPAMCRHLKLVERPGQSRGVPAFHAVLQDLRDLDLLIVACLKRVQIAACLSVFIKTLNPIDNVLDTTAKKYGYVLDQEITPGMIFKLYPDEEIQTLIPNFPVPELEPFMIMLARRVGAALGISWQVVLKDFSKSTYSSARTDLLESRQVYAVFQSAYISQCLNWEWQTVMDDAALRGDARLSGITPEERRAVHWIPNGWKWVDPVKEAAGAQLELEMGTQTLRDLCAEKGRDWEEQLRQRLREEAREAELRKEMGLAPKQAGTNDSAARTIALLSAARDEEVVA